MNQERSSGATVVLLVALALLLFLGASGALVYLFFSVRVSNEIAQREIAMLEAEMAAQQARAEAAEQDGGSVAARPASVSLSLDADGVLFREGQILDPQNPLGDGALVKGKVVELWAHERCPRDQVDRTREAILAFAPVALHVKVVDSQGTVVEETQFQGADRSESSPK